MNNTLRRTRFAATIESTFGDFTCLHCHRPVIAHELLSGVHNRNHCPHCLSSRCLDLFQAGDRLSACKARMRPVGLTIKAARKKYASAGELMLIHRCESCGRLSINRLAADDDPHALLALLDDGIDPALYPLLRAQGIAPLRPQDAPLVKRQLFGASRDR